MNKPPYQKIVTIFTKDGQEYKAALYHLNPQYHRKAKQLDRWRRIDDVPKKERWIDVEDVVSWKE